MTSQKREEIAMVKKLKHGGTRSAARRCCKYKEKRGERGDKSLRSQARG